MSWFLVATLILIVSGFVLTRLATMLIERKTANVTSYIFRYDPWLYMGFLMTLGMIGAYYFAPDAKDIITSIQWSDIWLPIALTAIIYFAFLIETDWLFYAVVIVSSALMVFFVPEENYVFEGFLAYWPDRILAVTLIATATISSRILNGMSGIFGIYMITLCVGSLFLSFFGGLPKMFGLITAFWSGIWFGFLNVNWYPSKIHLNDGACASAVFLMMWLFLNSVNEMAGSAFIILITYWFAELLYFIISRIILRKGYTDAYENTVYWSVFEKGFPVPSIGIAIAKIGVLNIILSAFQLYASNVFSMPLFALLVNFWLLNSLYHADKETKTLKQTNIELAQNVKDTLKIVQETFKKGKDR